MLAGLSERERRLQQQVDQLREENQQYREALTAPGPLPPFLDLTGHEELLFRHLVRREIVTPQSAMLALYGMEEERDPKIVDVFICRLRKKLAPFGAEIATLWARGYQLKDRARWRALLQGEPFDMSLESITFAVSSLVYRNVVKRCQPLNIRPSEYARRLFEAAYAARVAGERGEESGDAALDAQVRQVFLLADCEPEFIAETIGLPLERVTRILDGWRRAARDVVEECERPPAEEPATVDGERTTGRFADRATAAWPADMIATIADMWAAGRNCTEIGKAIGKTAGNLSVWMSKNRDLCPKRRS